jgi:ribosomal protein S18 acetylase RimI-like enzyme
MITINYYKSLSKNSSSNPNIIDKELVKDIYRLSCSMKKPDRPVWYTFATIFFTLKMPKKSLFFSANENNKKVAFGFYFTDEKGTDSKRLEFFAVEKQYRRQGIGRSVIEKFIKDKVGNSSLELACSSELRKFYKQCGLKFRKKSKDSEEIIMIINGFNPNHYCYREVQISDKKIFLGSLEKIEKLYDLSFDKKEFHDKTSRFFVQSLTQKNALNIGQRKELFKRWK